MKHATRLITFLSCTIFALFLIFAVSAYGIKDQTVVVTNNNEATVTFFMNEVGSYVLGAGQQVTFMQYEGSFLYTVKDASGAVIESSTVFISGGTTSIILGISPEGDAPFFTTFSWELVIFWAVIAGIGIVVLVILVQSAKIKYYRGKVSSYKSKEKEKEVAESTTKKIQTQAKRKNLLDNMKSSYNRGKTNARNAFRNLGNKFRGLFKPKNNGRSNSSKQKEPVYSSAIQVRDSSGHVSMANIEKKKKRDKTSPTKRVRKQYSKKNTRSRRN